MDKNTWLDKICQPLENPKYPQIKRSLALYGRDGEIVGKCAEGEVACQNGIPYDKYQTVIDPMKFESLGIPYDLLNHMCLPTFRGMVMDFNFDMPTSIFNYLFQLNDKGFSYPQIVEFLRTTFEDAV